MSLAFGRQYGVVAQRTDSGVKTPTLDLSSAVYLEYDLGQNI